MTATQSIARIRIARSSKPDSLPSPRRLAGFVTAGALTLSLILAAAVPARAGDRGDNLAKALIAAVIVGAIIHETKRDKPAPAPVPEPVRKKKRYSYDDETRIPAVCALEFEGEHRAVTVYPESCLRDEGVRGRLPVGCANEARIYGKRDRIYSERCLRDAGFTLPGKRGRY